jgi:ABC-type multidrug transport system fused ATPase/permease subunit
MMLTESHIEQLFKFTRKHYVYFYDVQSELVDHLANDIEEIWQEYPNLSFEQARDKSFKKFGIFGFMDVIEAKQKQMNKRYRNILWRFVKEWFTLPKFVVTATIFLSIFLVLQIKFSEYILLGIILALVVFDTVKQAISRKELKKKKQQKEKIFLLESMIGETRNGFTGITFINLFNLLNLTNVSFSSLETNWLLVISFSATLLIILFYVTAYLIPQKAEELLEETYPEYKIVNNL